MMGDGSARRARQYAPLPHAGEGGTRGASRGRVRAVAKGRRSRRFDYGAPAARRFIINLQAPAPCRNALTPALSRKRERGNVRDFGEILSSPIIPSIPLLKFLPQNSSKA